MAVAALLALVVLAAEGGKEARPGGRSHNIDAQIGRLQP